MSRAQSVAFWIVVVILILLTRVPSAAQYLSIDNVNLAFALEHFDPLNHQPQPPGYPFFVFVSRILMWLFRTAEYTFLAESLLVTAACLLVTVALGRRMFNEWSGRAAAFLFLVNPVFWHTGADSPLRPYLAFFSLLTAYHAWRCWNGERQHALWAALALGIGSGFRPELLLFLFPIWLVSAWIGTRSLKTVALGIGIISTVVLVWVGALAIAVGGAASLFTLISDYLFIQSTESPLAGAGLRAWLRQISRLVVWNGLAMVWWVWAVPIVLRPKTRPGLNTQSLFFVAVWLLPGLGLQAAVHVAAPGHTLFSIPALCLVGAYVLSLAAHGIFSSESAAIQFRETVFGAALVFNVMTFLNFFPLPSVGAPLDGSPSVTNAIAYATNESTLGMIRSLDHVASVTLDELRQFTPADRPSVIISSDVHSGEWFFNWRILRYYEPQREIWVLIDQKDPRMALLVRRYGTVRSVEGSPVPIPVPRGGRILWILDKTDFFYRELNSARTVNGGQYVVYTDISAADAPFAVRGFEFMPTEAALAATIF